MTIASTVADGFTHLKRDIEKFSKDFSQYLEDEKKRLTKEAEEYEAEIKKCQEEIDRCVLVSYGSSCSVLALEFLNPFVAALS